jgi:hypothetical protein
MFVVGKCVFELAEEKLFPLSWMGPYLIWHPSSQAVAVPETLTCWETETGTISARACGIPMQQKRRKNARILQQFEAIEEPPAHSVALYFADGNPMNQLARNCQSAGQFASSHMACSN